MEAKLNSGLSYDQVFEEIFKQRPVPQSSFGTFLLGCLLWFERICKSRFETRFKSLHFRLLKTAYKDYGLIRSKAEITTI